MSIETLNLTQPVSWKLAADKSGPRRFSMLAYTGSIFDVGFGQSVIDLAGIDLPASLAIFRQHDPNQYVGRADKIERTSAGLMLSGFLFDTPAGREIADMSDQGADWQASVGVTFDMDAVDYVSPDSEADVNGQTLSGPVLVIRKASLKESSFVPLGACSGTSAVALAFSNRKKVIPMADHVDPLRAERERVASIRKEFANDPEFALASIDAGLSLMEAKADYADKLQAKLAAQTEEQARKIADLEAKLAQASKPAPAAALVGGASSTPETEGDPIDQWTAALAKECERLLHLGHAANGETRQGVVVTREAAIRSKAVANLSERMPELHQAYLEALNGTEWTRRRRLMHNRARQIRALGGR